MSFYTTHFAYATEDWSSAVRQKLHKKIPLLKCFLRSFAPLWT
jgi:hypothetical protein